MVNKPRILISGMLVSLVCMQTAHADLEDECRQEAVQSGMESDWAEQYVTDCLVSRGGVIPADMELAGDEALYADEDESMDSYDESMDNYVESPSQYGEPDAGDGAP